MLHIKKKCKYDCVFRLNFQWVLHILPFFESKKYTAKWFTSLLERSQNSVVLPYKIMLQITKMGILTFDFGWLKMGWRIFSIRSSNILGWQISISTGTSFPRTTSAEKAVKPAKYLPNFTSISGLYTMEAGSVETAAMTEGQDSILLSLPE